MIWVLTKGENLMPLFSLDAPTPEAAGSLGLGVLIPPGVWMSVCYECCVLSGSGLCVGPITGPEEFYRGRCV